MAYTISVNNDKGGVGKTTAAINIANGLASAGKRVCLIDMDHSRNASSTYRAKSEGVATIVDVLKGDVSAKDAIQHMPMGDIIAGDDLLEQEKSFFSARPGREFILKKRLNDIRNDYDFIIVDTHPDKEVYTTAALTAADGVVIPINADDYSIDGLVSMVNYINELKEAVNPDLKLLGVFLTRFTGDTAKKKAIKDELPEQLKAVGINYFNTIVRESAYVGKALGFNDTEDADGSVIPANRSVFEHFPKSNAANDFANLIVEIVKEANK